jgi:hypothetical protein
MDQMTTTTDYTSSTDGVTVSATRNVLREARHAGRIFLAADDGTLTPIVAVMHSTEGENEGDVFLYTTQP